MIKLNLGSGLDHKPGWINADIDPAVNPEVVIDLTSGLPFKNNSVSEILLQDVLEHLTKQDALSLFDELHRIISPGGKLALRIPNIDQITSQFSSDKLVMMEFIYGNTQKSGVWGAHKYGYTADSITKSLKRSGFNNISVHTETTNFKVKASKSTSPPPKLHLLIIQQSPDWGGAEEWISLLINQAVANRVKVFGVTNFPKMLAKWKKSGATTRHLPFILDIIGNYKGLIKSILLLPFAVIWYSHLLSNAKKSGVNLILMSGFSEKLLVTQLARFFNLPVVWFEYGPLQSVLSKNLSLPKILYRLSLDQPSRVITISEHTKQSLINSTVSLAKLRVISPGVPIPKRPSPVSSLSVGSLSRLAPEKGQRLLLKSWPAVTEAVPKAGLRIAGSGPDKSYLSSQIAQLDLKSSVKLLGFTQDKNKFYQSLSVFVFPSVWPLEGFGIVAIEAMIFGLPIVGFNTGPIPEIVTPDTGILVDPGNTTQLSQAIISLLKNPPLRKKLGASAVNLAKEKYNLTTQASAVTEELTDVLKENS